MQFDIVGGSYKNKYISMNPQRTINWYIHKQFIKTEDDKYQSSLQPFPGLSSFVDTSGTTLRGHFVASTVNYLRYFIVVDNTLYECDETGILTSRGTLTDIPLDGTKIFMRVNGNDQM